MTTVHMPALNTPQFGWVRSRLPFHPQPVPPIYQPELAAEAIVWAAGHPRREYWIGYPTVGAILVNHIVPGLLDRYLARTNIEAQQSDIPVAAGRPDNLEEPVAGSQAAHGIFDEQAKSRSLQSRLSMYRQLAVEATAARLPTLVRRRTWASLAPSQLSREARHGGRGRRGTQRDARHPPGLPRRSTWMQGAIEPEELRYSRLISARPPPRSFRAAVATQPVAAVTGRYAL